MLRKYTCLMVLTAAIQCKPVVALDFLEAYELAKTSDPEIAAAEYQYQSVLETRGISLSPLLPNLSASVYTAQNRQEIENSSNVVLYPNRSIDYDADGYALILTQSIYNHSLHLQLNQTDLNISVALAEIESQRQALILRVAEAYFRVLAAMDNLKFAEAEKNAIGQQLEQTQKRFDVGLIAITDVKESQAQYDLSVASEISARNILDVNREALQSLIGQMPDNMALLAEQIPLLIPEPQDIKQWVDYSIQNNHALKSAQYSLEAAQEQVKINRSGHYPTLDLALSHDYTSPDGTSVDRDTTDTSITLQLNVPIYSGGGTNARTRQAVASMERAKALREKAYRQTVQTSRENYLGVTTTIAQVNANKQALISTQTAYEATKAGYDVGTRTAVEVLSVLREQYRAERDYAQARYNYILNVIRLKQVAGILSAEDVKQINQWLQN